MNEIIVVPEGKIKDYIDNKLRNDTPEEYVRQTIEHRLVEEHRYLPIQIAVEYGLKIGSQKSRADIVIWNKNADRTQDNIKIIIECKQEKISANSAKDGIAQLKSYMSACPNCEWGMWTNSVQKYVYRKITDANNQVVYEEYNDIPSANGSVSDVDKPTRQSLINAVDKNLLFAFRACHDHIYANDGLHKDKAFFEFLKIIFCKISDEKNPSDKLEFYATSMECKNPDGQLTVKKRIAKIFNRVKQNYKQIFNVNDEIILTPRSLASIVRELQKYSLLNTNIDIKGKAYEEIVGSNLRGDRGEFFTPRNIMKMVVDMIEPQLDETVLDSSCGTGGFLVIAMNHVINLIDRQLKTAYGNKDTWTNSVNQLRGDRISEVAKKNYFGFDLNPDLVKATKMNMVMNNDGSGNILQINSLLPPHEWNNDFKARLATALDIEIDSLRDHKSIGLFDIVVTNPPFGSKIPIDDAHILNQFELAHIWNYDADIDEWIMTDALQKSVPPEILFVERCTQFLKPGGRMGIILPDSILGSPGLAYIRTWIIKNHKILASLDLHADTFQPHNGTQTSVLILQKKSPAEIENDYDIFMARVDKVGHDKRGNVTYKRDAEGNEILINGDRIINDDTFEMANIYKAWKKKLHIDTSLRFCTVKLSEVKAKGLRLEAGVYDVKALNANQIITSGKFPAKKFCGDNGFADAYLCGRSKVIMADKSNLPFYQAAQIIDVKPKPSGYASKKNPTALIEYLRVSKGQLLMTRSGTVGKIAYVSDTLDNKIFTPDLLRINVHNDFDTGYIYTYFKTKIGNEILLQQIYGSVIQHVDPEHLENILIPDSPETLKRQIHELIVKSYNLRDESNDLIDKATQILIDELNLPDIDDIPDEKVFTVKASNLFGRLDASYHTPIVSRIVEHLHKHAAEVTTIGDSRISNAIILPGRFKRVYVDENHGRVFIGGKQIYELDPSNKKYLSNLHHGDRISKQLELHENTTLITCSGTIGKVAIVPKHWENWAASQHIIRVVPANINIAGYIYIWLNTDYAHKLINKNTYGAVVDEIDDKQVSKVQIPLLKSALAQEQINSLALMANSKRYEAYLLEQQALKIFESEVFNY